MMVRTIALVTAVGLNGTAGAAAIVIAEAVPRLLLSLAPNAAVAKATSGHFRPHVVAALSLTTFGLLTATSSLVLLTIILAVRTLVDAVWNLSIMRGVSELSPDSSALKRANARLTLLRSPIVAVGIAAGGTAYELLGPLLSLGIAIAFCALAFSLSLGARMSTTIAPRQQGSGSVPQGLLRVLAVAATNAAFAGVYNLVVPVLLLRARDYSGSVFGLVMGSYGIGVGAAAILLRRKADSWSSRSMIVASAVASTVGVMIIVASSRPVASAVGVGCVGVSSALFSNGFRLLIQAMQDAGSQRAAALANGLGSSVVLVAAGVGSAALALGVPQVPLLVVTSLCAAVGLALSSRGLAPHGVGARQ